MLAKLSRWGSAERLSTALNVFLICMIGCVLLFDSSQDRRFSQTDVSRKRHPPKQQPDSAPKCTSFARCFDSEPWDWSYRTELLTSPNSINVFGDKSDNKKRLVGTISQSSPPYSYHRAEFGSLLKPQRKSGLVAIPVGQSSKKSKLILDLATRFPSSDFDYVLFIYDQSDWTNHSLTNNSLLIHANRQMKWWYVKRFITPTVAVSGYDHVWILDEDSYIPFDSLDAQYFMTSNEIKVLQPAVREGRSDHPIIRHVKNNEFDATKAARLTNFIECGPANGFSSKAWSECIWPIVLPEVSSGWGLDAVWCLKGADKCGFKSSSFCTLSDRFAAQHLQKKTASSQKKDYHPWGEFAFYQKIYK